MNSNKNYQICKNCVMDTSDSKIQFNDEGICDHCLTFFKLIEPEWNYGKGHEIELEKLVEKIQKQGRKKDFDCILGMSGGIDSSYLTYYVKEKLNLRPLVFHVDAGWNTKESVNNIQRIVDGLDLDLFTEVINWEEMRDLQLSFFKSGVPHVDAPQDHAYFATMYKFANKHNIKTILTGANYSTECIRNPIEWMYYQSDSRQLKDIQRKFGTKSLNSFPTTNILWHKVWLPYFKKIKLYKPLDLISYIKEDAQSLLSKKFVFIPYKQKHFESKFTSFYESFWLYKRFGYDVRRVQFSSLILTKQMKREEALVELQKSPFNKEKIDKEIEFVANKLDIPINELFSYLKNDKKTYKNYRNNSYIYSIGGEIMSKLSLVRGGKR